MERELGKRWSRLLLLLVLMLWPTVTVTQPAAETESQPTSAETKQLATYLVGSVGDDWVYQQIGSDEPWILTVEEEQRSGRQPALRWDTSDGSYHLLSLTESGLRLIKSEDLDGQTWQFEQPAPLAPAELEIGARYESEAPYIGSIDGLVISEGKLRAIVEVLGVRSVTTPAGQFADCLQIRLELLRTRSNGGGQGIDLLIDLAPGVGVVRWLGELFPIQQNERGTPVRKIDLRLLEARIADRFIPDER